MDDHLGMKMLETSKANGQDFTGSVRLIHAVGMHARPAVKLTKLAKKFKAHISIRASDAVEWINAKSVAKVMALRVARDSIIEIKASGEDAESAVAALVDLVATDFPDSG
jgi:phosphocarrier protein HPr